MKLGYVQYPTPGDMTPRDLSVLRDIIIHHTDGPEAQTPLEIDAEHRAIGDAMIAYNFVITKDGTIFRGRPLAFENAANLGRNMESIAIVITGDFQPGTDGFSGNPTDEQVSSLKDLAFYIHAIFPQIMRTIGHRDIAQMFYPDSLSMYSPSYGKYSTACPGDNLYALLPSIRGYVSEKLLALRSVNDMNNIQELKNNE